MMSAEKKLAEGGLRFILICLLSDELHRCVYRIYTSDGGFLEYTGFHNVPAWVRDWMKERNSWEYVMPSAMIISGCKVVE